jgi:hypothetical protein
MRHVASLIEVMMFNLLKQLPTTKLTIMLSQGTGCQMRYLGELNLKEGRKENTLKLFPPPQ